MIIKKSLGQNFLKHPQIAERMVGAARVAEGLTVLEIGPGTGILTRALLAAGHSVIAVEADGELVTALEETFAEAIAEQRLTLIHADIRSFDTATIRGDYAVVSNIPYYITGEIIRTFLTSSHKPVSMTLLVQKEVAERIARSGKRSGAPDEKENLLSLSVKAYGTPEYCFTVPRGAFFPSPNVDSAVLAVRDIRKDAFKTQGNEDFFFKILKTGFAHRRKPLIRNLESLFPAERLQSAFEESEIPSKARPEDLGLKDRQQLSGLLADK